MSERNPYAPSAASVAGGSREPSAGSSQPPFFAVSTLKLAVMSIATLGLYELYWMYKNWELIRVQRGRDIRPLWRAILAVFFVYQLFKEVRDYDPPTKPGESALPAGQLAIGWIALTALWRLPDPFWWISFCAFLFLLPVQIRINRINTAVSPAHDPNSRFTVLNWVAVATGVAFVCLAIIGTLLPSFGPAG